MSKFMPWTHLYDTCLPMVCLLCGDRTRAAHHLCNPCVKSLPILTHFCERCAQALPENSAAICGKCLQHLPPYTRTLGLFWYREPVIHLILQLKFHASLPCAKFFSTLLIEQIRNDWYRQKPMPDVIIPVPLHRKRLRERGFNQALEIARPIAKQCAIPLDTQGLIRTRHTAAQSALPAKARQQNIANAFASTRSYQGLHVAVLDDVITTGHTISALCSVLQKAGANTIDVWCCARRETLTAQNL